jgi:hypothetical protein
MSSVNPNLNPEGVYELQGGIERYVKTFPEGGYWKGKNYLFDRRQEQTPGNKLDSQVEADMDSKCVVCRQKWTSYRGKFKCSQGLCGVPVIVCDDCREAVRPKQKLQCELCRIGYKAPQLMPNLVGLKRRAESELEYSRGGDDKRSKASSVFAKDRLFLARLPLTATKTKVQEALGGENVTIKVLHWLTDKRTRAFYGSCMVELESEEDAQSAVDSTSIKIDKKKIKVSYQKLDARWPPENIVDREYPPIGTRYV